MSKPKTLEWFYEQLETRNIRSIEVVGEFVNASTKVRVRCVDCGYEWMANPHHILYGHLCRRCALTRRDSSKNKRRTTEQFIEELQEINSNIKIIGEYVTAHTHIRCKCLVCQFEWDAKPSNLTSGYGCPCCAQASIRKSQAKSHEQFISELSKVQPNIEIVDNYLNNHTNVTCRCKTCGNTWLASPANLLRGTGCPAHNISHGEKRIVQWLTKHNIQYIPQFKFEDLLGVGNRELPYDFYIPDYNVLIEYQGNFHDHTDRIQTDEDFKILQIHDIRKENYAYNHGFTLICIWYYDNVEEILQESIGLAEPVTITA